MGTIVPETQGWVRDLEAVVGRIRAVAAARVVVDANDNIETIHVLAGRTRTVEQILADIQSVGAALFDLDIDPGRVRISQPEDWPGGERAGISTTVTRRAKPTEPPAPRPSSAGSRTTTRVCARFRCTA